MGVIWRFLPGKLPRDRGSRGGWGSGTPAHLITLMFIIKEGGLARSSRSGELRRLTLSQMLRFRCSKCAAKLGVAEGLSGRIITCGSCMAKLRVPETGAPPAPGSNQAVTKRRGNGSSAFPAAKPSPALDPQPGPGDAAWDQAGWQGVATPPPSAGEFPLFPLASKGTLSLPPLNGDAPSNPKAVPAISVTNPDVAPTEPPGEPFAILPRPDLAISDADDFPDGPPDPTTARLVWEDAKFLSRAVLPYAAVLCLLVVGFVYRDHVQQWLNAADSRMREMANPDQSDAETGLGDIEALTATTNGAEPSPLTSETDSLVADTDAPPATVPDDPDSVARQRVIETNVQITRTSGQRCGSGVIFRITDDGRAIVLTNRSVVDTLFRLNLGVSDPTLPNVSLTFADKSTAIGKVTWVSNEGLDVALIETTDYPEHIRPANCDGAPVGEGETLMFADIGKTWAVAHASVGSVLSTDVDNVKVFEVAKAEASVGDGTALYNTRGDLIAIAGGRVPLASAAQGSFAMLLHELKLPNQ